MQQELFTPELMYKDETAVSCIALIIFEVMECSDQTTEGFEGHMRGCAKLFELRLAGR